MVELKTKPTDSNVSDFLASVPDEQQRKDAQVVCDMMQQITGEQPRMWGSSIVGFGTYRYKYASGREGEWMMTGFSPRKNSLTLYFLDGYLEIQHKDSLQKLGPHKLGKGCLYLKHLNDIDLNVLRKMIEDSIRRITAGQAQL